MTKRFGKTRWKISTLRKKIGRLERAVGKVPNTVQLRRKRIRESKRNIGNRNKIVFTHDEKIFYVGNPKVSTKKS